MGRRRHKPRRIFRLDRDPAARRPRADPTPLDAGSADHAALDRRPIRLARALQPAIRPPAGPGLSPSGAGDATRVHPAQGQPHRHQDGGGRALWRRQHDAWLLTQMLHQ